ncbi:helix-turn-helix transcriptional regulator [Staphylococcus saprophyticus]|uniref:helix-turn-helix transcriptional regulator n=1 Tax=Staphylococcus saprophyticus TaxID=29385 RepID=UPI001D01C48A|nr:helix-turn-helix transcriptional regulator [Staphylococcus saprophyticus]
MSGLTESKLYYHFDSLKKKGLIEVTQTIREENRPDKQIFAITDQGKDALPSMIYKLFKNANQITEMYIGIANLKYVDKKKILYFRR